MLVPSWFAQCVERLRRESVRNCSVRRGGRGAAPILSLAPSSPLRPVAACFCEVDASADPVGSRLGCGGEAYGGGKEER